VAANGILPLAKRVLRERRCRLPRQGPPGPPSRTTTNRIPGKEDPDQGRGVGRVDGRAHRFKKKSWGSSDPGVGAARCAGPGGGFRPVLVGKDRDRRRTIPPLAGRASKFYDWRERYGRVNEHNGWVPRDFWLAPWEKQAIIGFHQDHPLEGYRRLTFMMLDADVVAVSPSSVWRVLGQAGLL